MLAAWGADASAVTPHPPVVDGPANQELGFSNGTYLVWAQNQPNRPNDYDAFIRSVTGGAKTQINAKGDGFPGSFDLGTDTMIYQQKLRQRSDLYLYDAVAGTRTKLPARINTDHWEWSPRLSGSFIMFIRNNGHRARLLAYDRGTQSVVELADVNRRSVYLESGGVGDEYATWTRCDSTTCSAWVHRFATDRTRKIPGPGTRPQYGAVVDETTGTIYWIRSGFGCGASVRGWRAPVGALDSEVKVFALPDRIDTGFVSSVAPNLDTMGTDMWFQRFDCRRQQGDIWVLKNVQPTG